MLKDQAFLGVEVHTAPSPWPSLDAPVENPALEKIRRWLVAHHEELRTWPPVFESKEQTVSTIRGWRKLRPEVEALEAANPGDAKTTLIVVTFWFYGHNIDEPGVGDRALALLEAAAAKQPKEPLFRAMWGFWELATKANHDAEARFQEALARSPDRELTALIELGWGTACFMSNSPHLGALRYQHAQELSSALSERYADLYSLARKRWAPTPDEERERDAIYTWEEPHVRSQFFGYEVSFPQGWQIDRGTDYSPDTLSEVSFDAPPLPDTGLIHGVMILSEVAQSGETPPSLRVKTEADGAQFKAIEPLIQDARLSGWATVRTTSHVGTRGDYLQRLYVEALVEPEPWTREGHESGAQTEGACRPQLQFDPGGETTVWRANPQRVNAPVRITILYNASRGTMNVARQRFKEILATLRFEPHAGSTIL